MICTCISNQNQLSFPGLITQASEMEPMNFPAAAQDDSGDRSSFVLGTSTEKNEKCNESCLTKFPWFDIVFTWSIPHFFELYERIFIL